MPVEFELHDVRDFPIVRFQAHQVYKGCGDVWCAEMDILLARDEPFALIYLPATREEDHEDRKMRGIWLKANKDALSGKCVALVVVEPDNGKRAELAAMLPNLERAFGTPQAARATQEEAEALARHVLAGGTLADAT
ncbi:GntR family transcriptional regulator [Brucella intermedia]|uniref:GntR family transcriptional regulator n=1 Tax=Brucella intermedia TaxID=94625 RepID=UPI00224B9AA9|nr:GntR family transcriptional regulator [Brucella intermedia]